MPGVDMDFTSLVDVAREHDILPNREGDTVHSASTLHPGYGRLSSNLVMSPRGLYIQAVVQIILGLIFVFLELPDFQPAVRIVSSLAFLVSATVTIASLIALATEPHLRLFPNTVKWSPVNRARLRRLIHAGRFCFLWIFPVFFTVRFRSPRNSEEFERHVLNIVKTVAAAECLASFGDMHATSYLPMCEMCIAWCWQCLCSTFAYDVNFSTVVYAFLLFELIAWAVLASLVLASRVSKTFYIGLKPFPNPLRVRFRHFIAMQLLVDFSSRGRSEVYVQRTMFGSLFVGLFHVAFKLYSVTCGAGVMSSMMIQLAAARRIAKPRRSYLTGVISVSDLRAFVHLQGTNVLQRMRELQSYVPMRGDRVAALSYKHHLPYVLQKKEMKLSPRDLRAAVNTLETRNYTHVWVDIAQNARAEPGPRLSTWFEEGVAPYLTFEVIALGTREQIADSMWLRLEEMCGLLGKGLYRESEDTWVTGLGLGLRAGIVQLGARASVGELAGCRHSYDADIDGIVESYGKGLGSFMFNGFPGSGAQASDDLVYGSQVTMNLMIPLPGLTEANWTDANGRLEFPIRRQSTSLVDTENRDSIVEYRLDERLQTLRVLTNRKSSDVLDEEHAFLAVEMNAIPCALGTNQFEVVCEVSSPLGATFRTLAEAEVTSNGNVSIVRHQWVGERKMNLDGFREVDHGEWVTW